MRIISLSLVIGLTAALYTKFIAKPTYTASYQLFFQGESGGLSGAMRLASSFGLGGMGGGSASSSATVQEFITSRNNIAHAMTSELENGRLIDRYYAGSIADDEEFEAEYRANFGVNQRYTDSILTQVFLAFNQGVLVAAYDEETGILGFSTTTYGEAFTYDLATQLVQNTESQFKDWKKEKGLAAVAAFQKFGTLTTIIDFGTALTFTTIGKNAEILGVAIAPGLHTAVNALAGKTAQLPEIHLTPPPSVLGENTVHAIQAGVVFGFSGLVDSIIEKTRNELNEQITVVATGGLSSVIAPLTKHIKIVEPMLTLDGLCFISNFVENS